MEEQVNVNFHQTFKPEIRYISSILNIADGNMPLSIKEISSLTGIPQGKSSGKVEPHISYTEYMGLITSEKCNGLVTLKKTKLGEVVKNEDLGLQEELSLLLCHSMMLREGKGASVWSAAFRQVLPRYKNGIKKEILLIELNQLFNGKINIKNLAPFISSYDDMFSRLGILLCDNEMIRIKTMQYDKDFIFLYAYVLYEYWDEKYMFQEEISSFELKELKFGETFGWNEEMEFKVLEYMSDVGLVRLNRQMMPYTVRRLVEKDNILGKLYSLLC